jgi:hypothetical protein
MLADIYMLADLMSRGSGRHGHATGPSQLHVRRDEAHEFSGCNDSYRALDGRQVALRERYEGGESVPKDRWIATPFLLIFSSHRKGSARHPDVPV